MKLVPEMVGERVFVRHIGVEDGYELRAFRRKFRELERAPLAKAKAQFDTSSGCATFSPIEAEKGFAVLRHDAPGVYHATRYGDASSLIVAAEVTRL